MPNTTFMQYYPDGGTIYVPQRRPSGDPINGRRASLSEIMKDRNKMDERRKSEAISEKAATLGGIQSLRQGKLPSNDQLDRIMNRLMSSRAIENNKRYMSADGQQLLQDFKELIQVFQRALKNKNRDELFQSMIYHVKRSEEAYHRDTAGLSGTDTQNVKEEVKSGAGAILKIAKLFLFNTQFRGLLEQILTIAQQTLGVGLQESGKMLNDKSKDPKLSKGGSSSSGLGGDFSNNASKGAKLTNAVKSAIGKTTNKADGSNDNMLSENGQNSRSASDWSNQESSRDNHNLGDHSSRNIDSNHQTSSTLGNNSYGNTFGDQRTGTIFGQHNGGMIFAHQTDQVSGQHAQLPQEHREFLSHRFDEPESAPRSTDDAGHSVTDDMNHGAPNPVSTTNDRPLDNTNHTEGGQTWLNNNMSSPMTPSAQFPDGDMPLSTHSTVIDDNTNGPNLNLDNGYIANTSSIQPTAQVPDSRLRNALATTRADHGYLTNLSSMNPTAQVSDSNLRNSLASAARQCNNNHADLDPTAPSFRPDQDTTKFSGIHITPLINGSSVDYTGANNDTPTRNEAVRRITERSAKNMQPIPVDTSARDINTVDNASALENVVKGADSLGGYYPLRADQAMMINRGADNMKPVSLDSSIHANDPSSFMGNTGVVKGDDPSRDLNALRAGQSRATNQGSSNLSYIGTSLRGNDTGSSMDNTGAVKGVNSLRNDNNLRGDQTMITTLGGSNMDPAPLDTSLRGNDISQHESSLGNTGAVKGVNSLRDDSDLRADQSMMTNKGIGATDSSNAGTWTSSGNSGWSSQQDSDNRDRKSNLGQQQSGESSRSVGHGQNQTFSANRMVNKMKQKAGADDSTTESNNADEESISTSEIIQKLKEIVTSMQKNSEYQEAISTLFSLFGVWGQRLKTGSGGMDRRRSSAVANPEQCEYYKNVATFEAKTIIEDWAGGKSLDPILKQFYNLSNKMKEDSNLHQLYEKVTSYIKKLLQEPGYVASDQSTDDGDKLVNEIRGSAYEEYKPHVRTLLQQSNDIVQTISNDETSQEISSKFKDIHNHLWMDGNGNPSFKPQLLNDMRITLLPAVIEQIKYVPLPQIVYSDKQYDIAIENMVLEGDTLMPDMFEIKADDYLRFSPYAKSDYVNSQSVNVHMNGIHTTMHDVIFYYKRKAGFPKMSDSGVINLTTGGSGLRVSLRITSSSYDQYHTFKVDQCHAHIDKLDINVSSCKHNIMYKVFNPVLTGIVKRQICKTIEKKMVTMFETGDEKLTRHLRISRNSIQNATDGSPSTGRPGIFSHAVNLLNKKVVSAT